MGYSKYTSNVRVRVCDQDRAFIFVFDRILFVFDQDRQAVILLISKILARSHTSTCMFPDHFLLFSLRLLPLKVFECFRNVLLPQSSRKLSFYLRQISAFCCGT